MQIGNLISIAANKGMRSAKIQRKINFDKFSEDREKKTTFSLKSL